MLVGGARDALGRLNHLLSSSPSPTGDCPSSDDAAAGRTADAAGLRAHVLAEPAALAAELLVVRGSISSSSE